jgi:hypothetical protein
LLSCGLRGLLLRSLLLLGGLLGSLLRCRLLFGALRRRAALLVDTLLQRLRERLDIRRGGDRRVRGRAAGAAEQ